MTIKRILLSLLFISAVTVLWGQARPLVKGMKISRSVTIKKMIYTIPAPADTSKPVILVEGNNIILDFNNAELKGSTGKVEPDRFQGLAVLVRNSKNVTIRNLKARGYKIALRAYNVDKLVLENCDFSYNYRQHLNSTQEKEDVSDWMSYHHNEKDEWLRYGAAIYLRNCDSAVIEHCKVTGGQNALMMMECNDGRVMSNDFSFNSGIGIGMYRSNRNTVNFNRLIFNVRGYSHGVYRRGQDSACILVYEQSNDNSFYYNNVTHGGDGFFLWAGQTTMDSGKGGCNNNIIYGNDFSYAPTNGIEVTFSSNVIKNNRMYECDHGIWGGYSYNTTIERNHFRDNRIGIAIEHGQHNAILSNTFIGDKTAIRLWSNKTQPADWGYAKYRDTRSAVYHISLNSFNNNPVAYDLIRTDSLWVHDNAGDGLILNSIKVDSTITHLDSVYENFTAGSPIAPVEFANYGKAPFEGSGKFRGRKNIMITEWGPYDFQYPLIRNTNPVSTSDTMVFELYGPKGNWSFVSSVGGDFPDTASGFLEPKKDLYDITDMPAAFIFLKDTYPGDDSTTDNTEMVLEFKGDAFTDAFGNKVPAGKPYRVKFQHFFQPIQWEVLFYSLDTAYHNPVKTNMLFSPLERKAPVKTEKVNKLDYAWWGGIKAGEISYRQFLSIAEGKAKIPQGNYELSVTWDDAVRVYLDNKLILDEWKPSRYSFDESPHKKIKLKLGGDHQFRVEHAELGGFAALSLKIKPVE